MEEWVRRFGASLPMRMTYMRLHESSAFFVINIFFLLSVSRGSRERKSALMAR
jgi:hypothetical protein